MGAPDWHEVLQGVLYGMATLTVDDPPAEPAEAESAEAKTESPVAAAAPSAAPRAAAAGLASLASISRQLGVVETEVASAALQAVRVVLQDESAAQPAASLVEGLQLAACSRGSSEEVAELALMILQRWAAHEAMVLTALEIVRHSVRNEDLQSHLRACGLVKAVAAVLAAQEASVRIQGLGLQVLTEVAQADPAHALEAGAPGAAVLALETHVQHPCVTSDATFCLFLMIPEANNAEQLWNAVDLSDRIKKALMCAMEAHGADSNLHSDAQSIIARLS